MKFQNNVHLVATVFGMSSLIPHGERASEQGQSTRGLLTCDVPHMQGSSVCRRWDPALVWGRKNYYFSH